MPFTQSLPDSSPELKSPLSVPSTPAMRSGLPSRRFPSVGNSVP